MIGLLFVKEIRRPAEEVWAVKVFDRTENPWMADEIGEPSEQEMRLVPQVAAEWPACLMLETASHSAPFAEWMALSVIFRQAL